MATSTAISPAIMRIQAPHSNQDLLPVGRKKPSQIEYPMKSTLKGSRPKKLRLPLARVTSLPLLAPIDLK
jgi:hypothetical protein